MEGYASSQTRALELQKQLLLKLRGELPEAVTMQRERTAAICFDLAEQHKRARKFDKVRSDSAREVGGGSAVPRGSNAGLGAYAGYGTRGREGNGLPVQAPSPVLGCPRALCSDPRCMAVIFPCRGFTSLPTPALLPCPFRSLLLLPIPFFANCTKLFLISTGVVHPPVAGPQAAELYTEALRHHETHVPSMLAVAKLHLANGDTDACQAQCVTLLKHDPDNEEASIMLAELMFHKVSGGGRGGQRFPGTMCATTQGVRYARTVLESVPCLLAHRSEPSRDCLSASLS